MLKSRVIPTLLLDGTGLYKTEVFSNPKYIGDPINAVKIFNEKNVDELTIFDISASERGTINYNLLERIAKEARMPLTYGGGISSSDDARKLIRLGFEKISISSIFYNSPTIIKEISKAIGAQSVVLCLDVKKNIFGEYSVYKNRGVEKIGVPLFQLLNSLDYDNLGEVIINNISKDGKQNGLDIALLNKIRPLVKCHLTMIGGLSGENEINELLLKFSIPMGIGGGACFVFKGKYKAVLLSYYTKITP
jgi:cyclase